MRRILIADDDTLFQELACCCLRQAGYEVATASDGAAAMGMLMEESFELAIIDLVMPQIDGLRLIALIRATTGLRELPILVITAEEDPKVRCEGFQVGANECMTKPVDWSKLPDMLDGMLTS
ncbi:MAG: response regulator [Alphaproteobacteria bacterium]|nr:response regulator [Alphaproteobacteria bacterium]